MLIGQASRYLNPQSHFITCTQNVVSSTVVPGGHSNPLSCCSNCASTVVNADGSNRQQNYLVCVPHIWSPQIVATISSFSSCVAWVSVERTHRQGLPVVCCWQPTAFPCSSIPRGIVHHSPRPQTQAAAEVSSKGAIKHPRARLLPWAVGWPLIVGPQLSELQLRTPYASCEITPKSNIPTLARRGQPTNTSRTPKDSKASAPNLQRPKSTPRQGTLKAGSRQSR